MEKQENYRLVCALVIALSAAGGFADAAAFLLFGVFGGHLTGNAVLTFVNLLRGDGTAFALTLCAMTGFIAGTAGGAWADRYFQAEIKKNISFLLLPAAAVAAASGIRILLGEGIASDFLCAVFLSLALGFQNGAIQKIGNAGLRTSYITGTVTILVTELVRGGPNNPEKRFAQTVHALVPAGFSLGALAGAGLTLRFGVNALLFLLILLPAGAWLRGALRRRTGE